jgi:hypothetical protein
MQENDGFTLAEVGPSDAQLLVAETFELDRSLPLPESVMGKRRRARDPSA